MLSLSTNQQIKPINKFAKDSRLAFLRSSRPLLSGTLPIGLVREKQKTRTERDGLQCNINGERAAFCSFARTSSLGAGPCVTAGSCETTQFNGRLDCYLQFGGDNGDASRVRLQL
ncbi:hypothetical protein CEXT_376791 [Caerostris extrusa]|uniref:Uncharacterized protein n=1 Tax=Caerostris extrusa TaxID=172846 RepID=A0AAV4MLQ5_CAEEX|nr:hypothetical protein CEXT_376791 [Caerostris extrusa]